MYVPLSVSSQNVFGVSDARFRKLLLQKSFKNCTSSANCTASPSPVELTHRSLDERGPVELVGGLLVARACGVDLVPREGLLLGFLRAAALAVRGRPARR